MKRKHFSAALSLALAAALTLSACGEAVPPPFHALGGYLYWMDYMPENFPQSLKSIYPIAYNYSYLLVEAVITVVIISIPAVAKGLNRVKQTAVE